MPTTLWKCSITHLKGMDLQWCKSCDVGLLRPDVTIFLDVSVETARLRGGFGEERYEKEDFQRRVRDIFMDELMEKDTWKVERETESLWLKLAGRGWREEHG